MKRTLRIAAWILGILLALPVLAIALLFAALNIPAGQDFAARQITALTGGTARIEGLSGRFPDRLRLAHLVLHDAKGDWLDATGIALDWSPLALLRKEARIQTLAIDTLAIPRLPASDTKPSPEPSAPFQLPVHLIAEQIRIAHAEIGAPVAGAALSASLDGSADVPSLESGQARLALTAQPAGTTRTGHYTLDATIGPDSIQATLAADEPAQGLLATLATLPDLGPIHLAATTNGPRSALAAKLDLSAGPLTAAASGSVDLVHETTTLDITAKAPAMRPAPGVSWQSVALDAHVTGPFTAPGARGQLRVSALEAGGAALRSITADLSGNTGQVTLDAALDGLRLPTPQPETFAATPIRLHAVAQLDAPDRPVRFTVTHTLLNAEGTARTAAPIQLDATLSLPDLHPLAAIGGQDLGGKAGVTLHATQSGPTNTLSADGTVALTAGAEAPLVGDNATFSLVARQTGETITIDRFAATAAAITLQAQGKSDGKSIDFTTSLTAPDLTRLAPTLNGTATLDAHVQGPVGDMALNAKLAGDIGAPSIPRAPLRVTADLAHLPATPTGHIAADGTLAGAPIALALDATRDADGTMHATITQADWRSLHAEGALTLPPGATLPQGRVALRFAHLEDLRPLIGQAVAGALTSEITLDPTAVHLVLDATDAAAPGARVARTRLDAKVSDPLAHPVLAATLDTSGLAAGSVTGQARLEANGPLDALGLRANAALDLAGTPTNVQTTATLDATGKQLRLATLQATARNETLRLAAPATIRFADGVAVDRLRLGLRQATLDVAGRLSPTLDATVTARIPASLAAIADPTIALDGNIALDAALKGTPAAPSGTVRLNATGIHARTGPGQPFPPANLAATAQLAGTSAQIDAKLTAGTANLTVNGRAPLGDGPLALRSKGALDLALLDPLLMPQGRRARGRLSLDANIAGTTAKPALSGQAQLANGEIQDFAQGVHLTALAATVRLDGDTARLVSLTGRAGSGTIAAQGTAGVLDPALPIDLTLTMRNAQPLASDMISANLDADLGLKGSVAAGLTAAGHVLVRRAELQIPSTFPASVAVLDVRRPGQKPPPPPAPPTPIRLDLAIDAPQAVFVRGRGVDAELGGSMRVQGMSTAPQVSGGLNMRRGSVSVAGTTLNFTRGKVGFDGTGLSGRIDPTLDFAADSTAGGVTATLNIGGWVSNPRITLSSVPELPQDEVLAYLIFKRSAKELGPFQIAQIAAALAELTGVTGGGGFNPLETVRKGLGLDRLSVGSTTSGSSNTATPTIEGGRYVSPGVYVGARQSAGGSNETQAVVQLDLYRGLKAEATAGAGQGANSVGLTYQFEY